MTHRVPEVEGFKRAGLSRWDQPGRVFLVLLPAKHNDIKGAERTLSLSHTILVPLENKRTSSADIIKV